MPNNRFNPLPKKGSIIHLQPVPIVNNDSKEGKVEYIEMEPKFVVNLKEPNQYLTINVQLMVEGEVNIKKLKKIMPVLRHTLIMMYSGRALDELQTMEQREMLCEESKNVIAVVLKDYANSSGLRDVFFTEFLLSSG